ncbi:hypothetical protein Tco_1305577 [Tanacetum coccineum]
MQQGDQLGLLIFALILYPLLHKIKDSCKLLLHAWYLDDGTVIRDSEEVTKVLDIIRPSSDVKLLGRAVSRDTYFISGLAIRRAANAVDLMSLLPLLHDQQSELLLLQSCMGIAKLFFGLRTCQPVHMEDATLFFDKCLRVSIENIVVCGGPFLETYSGDLLLYPFDLVVLQDHISYDSGICGMDDDYVYALACLRDTTPSFDFSDFTNKDTVPSKAQQTLVSVLFSEMVKDLEAHFDMTMRQKAVFECLRAPHAQDFLLVIPIDGLGQHMSSVEYHTILKRVGISAKKEALVNFLTDPLDGRSTLRPADVLVFGWLEGNMR